MNRDGVIIHLLPIICLAIHHLIIFNHFKIMVDFYLLSWEDEKKCEEDEVHGG